MKIAYAATFDVHSPETWAKRHLGLYNAAASIVENLESEDTQVVSLGTIRRSRSIITRFKWQYYRSIRSQAFYSGVDPLLCRRCSRQTQRLLAQSNADVLLCPENAIPLANVEPDRPMVLWTDATLGSLVDFYPYLSNLCEETRRHLRQMEQRVLDRCSLLIVNSEWAAQQAIELYDIPRAKVEVIPRGANKIHNLSANDVEQMVRGRDRHVCKLLFVAVEWERKGGDMALEVARSLNQNGIQTELHVVGCSPPENSPSFVKAHGFIDRTAKTGQAKMDELFRAAHFLMYPTRADALGMALSEAAAFGVPALASRIGGIPGIVKSGITGETFAVNAGWNEYCEFVIPYMKDMRRYEALAMSTFRSYQNHMGWPAVGAQAREVLRRVLSADRLTR